MYIEYIKIFAKNEKKNYQENQNGKKNNCMDISSDKLRKLHGMTWIWKPQEKKWILTAAKNDAIRTNNLKENSKWW